MDIIELKKEFDGRGSMKGFHFRQLDFKDNVYLYEVSKDNRVHYEVFERMIVEGSDRIINGVDIHFDTKVFYPNDEKFGVWKCKCCCHLDDAKKFMNIFIDELKIKKENASKD